LLSISIIIICYNSERFIKNCIDSLIAQTVQFGSIIVVDNNSKDNTRSICKQFKQVDLIPLDYNSGYSKAANIGIDKVNSDLYLISNADTKYDKNFVKNTVSYFTDNKNVDLLSPLMLRFDQETVDSAGQTYSLAFHPKEIGYNRKRKDLVLNTGKIFSVCGAASVFSHEALRKLKLGTEYYDEDFFMFWEDFDIGWRANLMGMNTVFNPDSIVYHYRSGTLKKNILSKIALSLGRSSNIKFHLIKNRYLTLIKNFNLKKYWLHIPFIILKDIIWVIILTISSPKIIINILTMKNLCLKAYKKRILLKEMIKMVEKND